MASKTKEKWVRLTVADLRQSLAEDEIEKLKGISIDESVDDVLQVQLDSVADAYRAAFMAKGYRCDVREHYVPNGYRLYVLALARYWCWTRFPNSEQIALDDPRKKLFEKAQELLENPYLATPDPDYSDLPEPPEGADDDVDSAITMPFMRILPTNCNTGFLRPYLINRQTPEDLTN